MCLLTADVVVSRKGSCGGLQGGSLHCYCCRRHYPGRLSSRCCCFPWWHAELLAKVSLRLSCLEEFDFFLKLVCFLVQALVVPCSCSVVTRFYLCHCFLCLLLRSGWEEGESLLYVQVLCDCAALAVSSRYRFFHRVSILIFRTRARHSSLSSVGFCNSSHPVSCTSMSMSPSCLLSNITFNVCLIRLPLSRRNIYIA